MGNAHQSLLTSNHCAVDRLYCEIIIANCKRQWMLTHVTNDYVEIQINSRQTGNSIRFV